jgi:Arc/MetJ family transcription regulator
VIEYVGRIMADAIRASGAKTKREAVELGLAALVWLEKQARIRTFRGTLKWRDDLERMRSDRRSSWIPVCGWTTSTPRRHPKPATSTAYSV